MVVFIRLLKLGQVVLGQGELILTVELGSECIDDSIVSPRSGAKNPSG